MVEFNPVTKKHSVIRPPLISELEKGTKVKLNVGLIKSHPDWVKLSQRYKTFVLENAETVFSVEKSEYPPYTMVTFKEDSNKWLFYIGDLILFCEEEF